MIHNGPFKNIVDAVRDWVNLKEQQYKPGEIYEPVPDQIIKMLWDGDVTFDELVPVSGAEGLDPVDQSVNYMHFLEIFCMDDIRDNALTFTNTGDEQFELSFVFYYRPEDRDIKLYTVGEELSIWDWENEHLTVLPGESVKVVGYNPQGISIDDEQCGRFTISSEGEGIPQLDISGNIMSLIDMIGQTKIIPCECCFNLLFLNLPVVDVSELSLSATTLTISCYEGMFRECELLETAPELSATTLANYCYSGMFYYCTNLATAPKLPATTLARSCYNSMFVGCTSLTTVPELPATTLAEGCYEGMFINCTNLATVPELPATTLVDYCYRYMFSSCSNLNYIKCLAVEGIDQNNSTNMWTNGVSQEGVFVKNINANWPSGNNGIPQDWEVRDYNPDSEYREYLTFTALENGGLGWYNNSNQSIQAYVEYSTNKSDWEQFPENDFVYVNTSQKIYVRGNNPDGIQDSESAGNDIINGFIQIEGSWDVSGNIMSLFDSDSDIFSINRRLYHAYEFKYLFGSDYKDGRSGPNIINTKDLLLPAITMARSCYSYMFSDCSNLTTAPELPATTLTISCYEGMFSDCSNLTTAPELPATTLTDYCYSGMFYDCSNLNYIKCLAVNNIGYNTTDWVLDIPSRGTFIKHPDAEWSVGQNGIPEGWTVIDNE